MNLAESNGLQRLLAADVRLSARLRVAEKPGLRRALAAVLAHSGDSWYWFGGLAGAWWLSDGAWKAIFLKLLVGLLATAAMVVVIKYAVRRRRPQGEWGTFYRRTDPNSFPSGHAARMMMLAVMALVLGQPAWGLALLPWALLVALARVAMGVHYLSDVGAGMGLGLAVGLALGWMR